MNPKQLNTTEKNKALDSLIQILKFPSISTNPSFKADVLACKDWLINYCKGIGFPVVECLETAGHPSVYCEWITDPSQPTLLIYGHYDVQPPEPYELWHSPPFEPRIQDGFIYARGASDNKGMILAHLEAIRLLSTQLGQPPINIKCIIEGEEEIGSMHLEEIVKQHKSKLAADLCLVSDNPMFDKNQPSICLSLRGLACLELCLTVMDHDVHSGQLGGVAPNPIFELSNILSQLHTKDNLVAIDGFYEGIPQLEHSFKNELKQLGLSFDKLQSDMQACFVNQSAEHEAFEQLWYLPTLECNGIWGGYTGPGVKTVIPAKAHAKLSMRLVGSQNPQQILQLVGSHLQKLKPKHSQLELKTEHGGFAYQLDPKHPAIPKAYQALKEAFGVEPVLQGEGGSIPILALFKQELNCDTVLIGLNYADDCIHAPNERFLLDNYYKGIMASTIFIRSLSQ